MSVPVSASTQVVGKFDSTNSAARDAAQRRIRRRAQARRALAGGRRHPHRRSRKRRAQCQRHPVAERRAHGCRGHGRLSTVAPDAVPSSIATAPGRRVRRPPPAHARGAAARPNWDVYGFVQDTAQRTETRPDNDRTGLGGSYQISSAARLGAEVSDGSLGFGGKALDRLPHRRSQQCVLELHAWPPISRTRLNVGRAGTLTTGTRYRFDDATSVYGEERMQTGTRSDTLTRAYGVDFSPSKQWTYGLKFERGTISDPLPGRHRAERHLRHAAIHPAARSNTAARSNGGAMIPRSPAPRTRSSRATA